MQDGIHPWVISLGYKFGSYEPSWKVDLRPRNFSWPPGANKITTSKIIIKIRHVVICQYTDG